MANKDNTFSFVLDKFYTGFSPLAFTNSLTEFGSAGSASVMQNIDCLSDVLTQGPGLATLTGTLTEAIQFIMDRAVSNNVSYAIGTSKLYALTATFFLDVHTISECTEGESLQYLNGNIIYFYNTASAGAIGTYDLNTTYNDTWTTGLELAPHPSDTKEDIILFGNGRYAGVYIAETSSMTLDKLDFGIGNEVADVLYNAGLWYIAVNSNVTGINRSEGQVYLYDGAALINTLTDETGVGMQRIGFLYRINGIVYVAYQDLSSTGFIIGYINGKAISPLCRFTGTLPTFNKKTLYKNTILFLSDNLAYCAGALVPQLPYALSQIASSLYTNATAIAAPFGTPMIASNNGATYVISKFSGYNTSSTWKNIIIPLSAGKMKGKINEIIVLTNTLGAGASASLTFEYDQASGTSSAKTITTTGKRRHVFQNFGVNGVEDARICLDFSGGSATNPVKIRKIIVSGNWVESI
jgi:hypothetical protein